MQRSLADLIGESNDLLRLVYLQLGGLPLSPTHLQAGSTPASPRPRKPRVPGQNVTVLFTWDAASDGGITVGYTLQIFGPDGALLTTMPLPLVTAFSQQIADDNQTYAATLVVLAADGTPSAPATVQFVPHTEGPPPPLSPAQPQNFAAAVS